MLKLTLVLVLGGLLIIGGILAIAATRPDHFRVQRSATIQAPPDRIYPLINDLRSFNTWNPYEKKDPNVVGAYSGPSSGAGAAYAFTGNKEVGKGTIRITSAKPAESVRMDLVLLEPFPCDNRVEFRLEPQGSATKVTWALEGKAPLLAKVVHLFLDMDAMVGKDFEAGLAGLKKIAEA